MSEAFAATKSPNHVRDDFRVRCQSAIDRSRTIGAKGHAGVRGALREILVRDMLKPVLPPEVEIGSGHIISHRGDLSGETDVILYARQILPPALFDESKGYIPAESVLYSIEVKSRLSKAGLQSSIISARAIRSLPLLPTFHFSRPTLPTAVIDQEKRPTPGSLNMLFAFGSDLKGDPQKELLRYREHDEAASTNPALDVICIVGRGYFYFTRTAWRYMPATGSLTEVLTFLGGLTNTLPKLIAAKGRPQFGHYLDEGYPFVDLPS